MITQDELKTLLDYEPRTGVFRWRFRPNAETHREKLINTRHAGTVAGSRHKFGIRIKIAGVPYMAHRLAMLWMTGAIPPHVLHANGDIYDNRWANLIARKPR